ncbi:MAG: molecular chaperone HtpG [Treponema porcinum]|uniref:Chaperone protein HtpG n=1 Tax=Treponema porcinum TaxID=261392 RepID=A0A1T4JHS6_TREPO|nr:molecular chaperone HtpG [Treponema porcinum]MCI6482327.1 molecular chaperone HtpG [Treponema porcinum]MDD7126633.1 molecular chaperone HtpG [Treponema porcinum]MDY4468732.1 molecular chaperone HtpG [Treponema porcinum]MDY5121004.1 molecular chaperone HtpG [Treponema porcinum]MDY5454112.1 molecular chaperone HtpG [Treponema porcinum]
MAKHEFQTEVNQLLQLLIHSLYSNKDIFLREIVSNASDALDKLKYLTVSDDSFKNITFTPKIDISFDEKAGVLTVQDTGIGMTDEDLQNNLGTIARSGTKAFLQKLSSDAAKDSSLIGQFGVGFYSAFMAAKKIDVYTKKAAGDGKIWHWSSDGTNSYDLDEITADSDTAKKYGLDGADASGSAIVMQLNDESKEYASRWKIEELIKRYSDHIAFPIYLHYEQNKYDDKGNITSTENKVDQVNSASALWKRPKSELKPEDYNEFYKTIGHDGEEPLHYVHTHAEGTQEYTTLFFIPQRAPFDMYQADYKSGVKLYVKRVFITDDDRELLPAYLRFVRGVIDSEDLPLNVSREILQQNRILETIKSQSVKKLLGEFKKMGEAADKARKAEKPTDDEKKAIEKWNKFVSAFNRPMKEGLYSDYANRDEIAEIVRFKSTDASGTGDDNWTSFADYVQRMKPDQKAIYYITGSDEKNLRENPLLKAYTSKGFEVLIMADDIDDIVIPGYGKYKDFELKAVNRAGSDEELGVDKEEAKKKEEEFKPVTDKIKKALGDEVKEVKLSKRLGEESPSCIVVDENDPSFQMERMMRAMGQEGMSGIKPILEINADHPLVTKIRESDDEALIKDVSNVLLDQALLIAGVEIKEPAEFVKSLNNLLSK